MSNIIDSIQLSGVTYTLQGSGGGTVSSAITSGDTNAVAGGAVYDKFDEVEQVTARALNDLDEKINPTVELTQAEYDALVSAGTVSADTYYIISDATAFDPTTKVDTSAITSSVTSASTDSQIPTAKAVWEAASGGGTTYTAGRGISIANDTISFNLPISGKTNQYSITEGLDTHAQNYYAHAEGHGTNAGGEASHTEGAYTSASKYGSHAEGIYTKANNRAEHASGQYNVSNKASDTFGDSGNTLFSVGNGTAENARHNAFEIRQNGDIYLSLNGQDVKLQDHLGGGGGGKAIEAGRGISVTTGETADTVSISLPISAGTGTNSIIGGKGGSTQGNYSFVFGLNNTCGRSTIGSHIFGESNTINYGCSYTSIGGYSNTATTAQGGHIEGMFNNITNNIECASGWYNVSNKASTTFGDSGNTLFSVGNGTADNARHNAFEIRQNGDIYLSSGGTDIKLQDYLGGGSITVDTALDSASTNPVENRVIYNKIDEVEQVTARALNELNDNFGGLKLKKLTQAEYDALTTKDSSTLYIIVN